MMSDEMEANQSPYTGLILHSPSNELDRFLYFLEIYVEQLKTSLLHITYCKYYFQIHLND